MTMNVSLQKKQDFPRLRLISLLFLALSVQTTTLFAMDMTRYTNARFGTSAKIPTSFIAAPPPQNGDGGTFEHPGGRGEIRVWGGYNILSETIAGYRQQQEGYLIEEGVEISYAPRGKTWFVFSGYADGDIYYLKSMHNKDCAPELIHHISFRYPIEDKALWDHLVKAGSQSLSGPCPE